MTGLAGGLLAAAAVLAPLDWVAKARRWRARPATKAAVLVTLGAVALTLEPVVAGQRGWVLAALALGLAGDLALLRSGGLARGASLFAAGHVCYLVGFAVRDAPLSGVPGLGVLLVATVAVAWRVLPAARAGSGTGLAGGVAAYLVVLLALVVGAVLGGGPVAALGAVAFALSDLALLHDRFVGSLRRLGLVATALYHLAQGLLVVSLALG